MTPPPVREQWSGLPDNPKESSWHQLCWYKGGCDVAFWSATDHAWHFGKKRKCNPENMSKGWTYEGQITLPSEGKTATTNATTAAVRPAPNHLRVASALLSMMANATKHSPTNQSYALVADWLDRMSVGEVENHD